MSRKTCSKVIREDLVALQIGELNRPRDWARKLRLQRHLGRCAACSAEWEFLQRIALTARELRTAEAPLELMARNRNEVVRPAEPLRRRRAPIRPVLALCGLGLAFSAGTALWPEAARWADRNALPKVSAAEEAAYRRFLAEPMPKPNRWDAYAAADAAAVTAERPRGPVEQSDATLRRAAEAAVKANGEAYRLLATVRGDDCRIPLKELVADDQADRDRLNALGYALAARATAQRLKGDLGAGARTGLQLTEMGLDLAGAGDGSALAAGIGHAAAGLRVMAADLPKLSPSARLGMARRLETRLATGINLDRVLLATRTVKTRSMQQLTGAARKGGLPANDWLLNADRNAALWADYVGRLRLDLDRPASAPKHTREPGNLGIAAWVVEFGALEQALVNARLLEAQARCMAAALRVGAYTARQGKAPRDLKQAGVTPELGADPFTGKPLRYVVDKGTVLLYSVGPNLRDDGGTPDGDTGVCPTGAERHQTMLGPDPISVPYLRRMGR